MPASMHNMHKKREDRTHLDGWEMEIFKLVQREAALEHWREWLQVPLELAAAKGKLDLFTRLMDAGAEVDWWNFDDCDERTLLGAAAYGKSEKIVRALLTAGAKGNVNALFGPKEESALHVAAARGAEEASKALMIAGADPDLLDKKSCSPLHRAAEAGHHGVIGNLLLKGADVNATNDLQETPLHLAAFKGHAVCISELLLGGADKDVVDRIGQTPLYKGAKNNHLEAVEKLLAAGANRGIYAHSHFSPLEIAATRGHAAIVKAFLDEDSSAVHAVDEEGVTVLHCCANEPDYDLGDVVRVLLGAGADVQAKTTDDVCETPLHVALCYRRASVGTIRALIEGGANVNVRDVYEQTPLHVACIWSSVAAVEILLRWGADEKLTDVDGETPAGVIGSLDNGDEDPADAIESSTQNGNNDEEIGADNERIRQMLASAPADRSWRRRGWLVLSRSCPTRVQISNCSGSGSCIGSSKGCSAKVESISGEHLGGDGEETEHQMAVNSNDLVSKLVGLEADGLFRLVVGFL